MRVLIILLLFVAIAVGSIEANYHLSKRAIAKKCDKCIILAKHPRPTYKEQVTVLDLKADSVYVISVSRTVFDIYNIGDTIK